MSPRKPSIRRLPPPPPPPVVPLSLYRKIGVSFIIVAVLLVVLVVTVTTAKAKITISLKSVPLATDLPLTISRAPTGDELSGAVTETVVDGERAGAVSGEGTAVPAKAHGVVTLKNTTNRNQPLVATTRVLSKDGVLFRIIKSVVVPANAEVKVEVAADKPGKESEIGPSKFTIPGLATSLHEKIFGESVEAMRGGEARTGVVTEDEVKKIVDELTASLIQTGQEKLKQGEVAKAATGAAWKSEVVSREVVPVVGSKASEFKVKMKVRVWGVFFDREASLVPAQKALVSQLTAGTSLSQIPLDKLAVRLDNASVKDGVAHITLHAEGLIATETKAFDTMKARLGGLDKDGVAAIFRDIPGVSSVEVQFKPPWVRRAPGNPDRIQIVIQQ